MRATKHGIECSREELRALLTFAGDTERYAVVQFRVNASAKLIASATDGHRAVECTAPADADATKGEWAVDRTFIESARRVLDKDETMACFKVTRTGLREVIVKGIESGDERERIRSETEAATTQISMDQIRDLTKKQPLEGSWFALNPIYFSDIKVVSAATDKCPITIYPPEDPISNLTFEASGAGGRWRGCIAPVRVQGPGDEAEKETDDETPGEAEDFKLQPTSSSKRRAKASKKATTKKKPAKKATAKKATKKASKKKASAKPSKAKAEEKANTETVEPSDKPKGRRAQAQNPDDTVAFGGDA